MTVRCSIPHRHLHLLRVILETHPQIHNRVVENIRGITLLASPSLGYGLANLKDIEWRPVFDLPELSCKYARPESAEYSQCHFDDGDVGYTAGPGAHHSTNRRCSAPVNRGSRCRSSISRQWLR